MLIPGNELNGDADTCFYGVFRSPLENGNWIFGVNAMKNYYVVYDATDENLLYTWFGERSQKLQIDKAAIPGESSDDWFQYFIIGLEVAAVVIFIGGMVFFCKARSKSDTKGFASAVK